MLVGLKSPRSLPPQSLSLLFARPRQVGGSCGRGGPSLCVFLLPLPPASSTQPECGLGLPRPPQRRALFRRQLQDAPDPWLPAGPLPVAHSQPQASGCPATLLPAPVRLPPTHPAQTSSQSTALLKAGESRARGPRAWELRGLRHIINKEIALVERFPQSSKPRNWYDLISQGWT